MQRPCESVRNMFRMGSVSNFFGYWRGFHWIGQC